MKYTLTERKISFKIPSEFHTKHVHDESQMRFVATAKVEETEQYDRSEVIVDIKKPDVEIENPPKEIISGQEATMYVTFDNPLSVDLTEVEMYMDGTIISDRIYWKDLPWVLVSTV